MYKMVNKLKSIFSNAPLESEQKIEFQDRLSYENFEQALQKASASGEWEEAEGNIKGQSFTKIGEHFYPVSKENNFNKIKIRLASLQLPIPTEKHDEEIYANFYREKDRIVIENIGELVKLKIILLPNDEAKVTFSCDLEKAKCIEDIVKEFENVVALLDYVFRGADDSYGSDENREKMTVRDFKIRFHNACVFWKKIDALEQKLGKKFDLSQIEISNDTINLVEELYYLLIENKIIRLDAQLSDGKIEGKKKKQDDFLKEGVPFSVTFLNSYEYNLGGNNIKVYAVNYLLDAVIKEIHQVDGEIFEVIYGDSDTSPMYIAFTGFLNEDEAQKEHKFLDSSDERKQEYRAAKILNEYIINDFAG